MVTQASLVMMLSLPPINGAQDLQCMNMRYLQKRINALWPKVSNNLVCINDRGAAMYLQCKMCFICISAIHAHSYSLWSKLV